ncbi:MAG: hypothetical protein KG029_06605 [Bacteroidetes bacterium]|nr:hypothetical protein [Bacteroidota bacterium]
MKNKLLLLLLAFIISDAVGQTTEYKDLVLSVEKKLTNSQTSSIVILKFKPGKVLQIKTVDGRKLVVDNYFLLDNSRLLIRQYKAVSNALDTISLQDIASIRGKVYGDTGRKMVGGAILIASYPLGGKLFYAAMMGGPAFLVAIPFVGIPFVGASIAGISMLGPRRFNTTDRWELKVIER